MNRIYTLNLLRCPYIYEIQIKKCQHFPLHFKVVASNVIHSIQEIITMETRIQKHTFSRIQWPKFETKTVFLSDSQMHGRKNEKEKQPKQTKRKINNNVVAFLLIVSL